MSLQGKTLFITGASRGIGLAIALRAARDGANVVIAAKTTEPHPKLDGTIYTAAEEVQHAGGQALAVVCDVRSDQQVQAAVDLAVQRFGGIDICVNNAGAVYGAGVAQTPMKRFDLLWGINGRGAFMVSKFCLPWLRQAENPHILMISPPLELRAEWFAPYTAYALSKYGMSLCALGLAGELRGEVSVNALWPRTVIATAAVRNLGGEEMMRQARTPEIMGDAAHLMLTQPAPDFTEQFCIDEDLLRAHGREDFDSYRFAQEDGPLMTCVFTPSGER